MAFENVLPLNYTPTVVADVAALKALAGPFTEGDQVYVLADGAYVQWQSANALAENQANGIFIPNSAPPTGRWVYVAQDVPGIVRVQNAGTPLALQPQINFTGSGISSIADDAANNRTTVDISGGAPGMDTIETFNLAMAGGNRVFSGPPGDTIGAVVVAPTATTLNGLEALILQGTGGNAVQYAVYDVIGNRLAFTASGVPGTIPSIFSLSFASPVALSAGRYFFAIAMPQGGCLVSIGGVGSGGISGAEIAWQDNNLLPDPAPITNALTQSVWMKAF